MLSLLLPGTGTLGTTDNIIHPDQGLQPDTAIHILITAVRQVVTDTIVQVQHAAQAASLAALPQHRLRLALGRVPDLRPDSDDRAERLLVHGAIEGQHHVLQHLLVIEFDQVVKVKITPSSPTSAMMLLMVKR